MEQGYNEEQFLHVTQKKIPQPFEKLNYQYIKTTTDKPCIEDFFSRLKGVTTITKSLQEEYKLFCDTWDILQIPDYYTMLELYACLDSVILMDAILFYFDGIWKMTNLYPSYYATLAGR